ncbi:MAG: hypothetical protein IH608_07385 [Proteobacteria bacterium]|nr:hypothetical protein [Pseudomonadota bacterium]
MEQKRWQRSGILRKILLASAGAAWAATAASGAQVVSEGDRAWARQVLQQEQSIEAEAPRNTVGVLYFRNRTGDPAVDPMQKGLALMLITDLAAVRQLQVVERVRLQALLEELGLGKTGLVEEGSAPRVGRLLGTHWLVGGQLLSASQGRIGAAAEVVDVPKADSATLTAVEADPAEFFRLEKDVLFQIIENLRVELEPAQRSRLRIPCSQSTTALLDLFRAVDASDGGDYEGAALFYESALRKDPEICLARTELRELQVRRLVAPRAQASEVLESLRGRTSLTTQVTTKEQLQRQIPAGSESVPVDIEINFP